MTEEESVEINKDATDLMDLIKQAQGIVYRRGWYKCSFLNMGGALSLLQMAAVHSAIKDCGYAMPKLQLPALGEAEERVDE